MQLRDNAQSNYYMSSDIMGDDLAQHRWWLFDSVTYAHDWETSELSKSCVDNTRLTLTLLLVSDLVIIETKLSLIG